VRATQAIAVADEIERRGLRHSAVLASSLGGARDFPTTWQPKCPIRAISSLPPMSRPRATIAL
jgi:hypothetical protein